MVPARVDATPPAKYEFVPHPKGRNGFLVFAYVECPGRQPRRLEVGMVSDPDSDNPGLFLGGLLGFSAVYEIMELVRSGEWRKSIVETKGA